MILFPFFTLLAAAAIKNHIRTDHLLLQQIRRDPNGVVWVDLENVRGKSGFELTHDQALQKTVAWTNFHNLHGKVIFVVDHGSVQEAYNYQNVMSIVFAGPSEKADDVIAHGVPYFDRSIVITADTGLQQRCRRNSSSGGRNSLHIVDPSKFLDDLEMVPPSQSIQQQQEIVQQDDDNDQTTTTPSSLSLEQQVKLGALDEEIRLRGQILDAEIQLYKKKTMTKKRRKKLQSRIDKIRQKLVLKGPSLLEEITSLDQDDNDNDDDDDDDNNKNDLDSFQKQLFLSRWREIQNRSPRREQTGDRVVYAEQLRRQIMECAEPDADIIIMNDDDDNDVDDDNNDENDITPAKSFLMHINGISKMPLVRPTIHQSSRRTVIRQREKENLETARPPITTTTTTTTTTSSIVTGIMPKKPEPSNNTTYGLLSSSSELSLDTLTVVAVSDTHGFEGQLINEDSENPNDILPPGDLLIHLGDFARDGSKEIEEKAAFEFDAWLAKQPHTYKIVVRGNHDPWSCDFSQSGAWYVTKPISAKIGDFVLAIIPHGSARTLTAAASASGISWSDGCDILATHVPPYKILDQTFTGKYAGSQFLTKTVRHMRGEKIPRLWLCGHIHEGRGMVRRHLGSSRRQTLVVNAANANPGRATHLEHGPVSIQLSSDDTQDAEVLVMESKVFEKRETPSKFYETDKKIKENVEELLLSVDLGLKSGVAMFSCSGSLIRYEQFLFKRETLERDIQKLVQAWENESNNNVIKNEDTSTNDDDDNNTEEGKEDKKQYKITHIAIEGADMSILQGWTQALPGMSILRVPPEEWRCDMLTEKEKSSGSDSKAAARLIARQIVSDFGIQGMGQHQGKFPTDVAEAVVMGSYVAKKLGWISRDPLVRRYTNDNIVVPKIK